MKVRCMNDAKAMLANVCRERNSVHREKSQLRKRQRVAWVLCCMMQNGCRLHSYLVRKVYIHRGTPHRVIESSVCPRRKATVPTCRQFQFSEGFHFPPLFACR